MIIRFTDEFRKQYRKADKRIKKSFDKRLELFIKNPNSPQLNNHPLREPYQGQRSIDITNDWRAIYKSIESSDEAIIYFTALGVHSHLYR